MVVKRKELCNVLESIKPGLATKEILEQTTHFIFDRNRVYTFNDQIMVNQQFQTGIKGTVEGQTLLKVLSKIPDDQVEISASDGELRIKGRGREIGLRMVEEVGIEIPFDTKREEWFKLPEGFLEGMKFCIFSASKDVIKGPLVCIQCQGDRLVSCDNYRLTVWQMEKEFKFSFLLPRTAAEHLINYNPTLFTSTDSWLHFQNEDKTTFSCRTMEEKYPDVSHLLDFEGKPVKFPDGFKDNVERAGLLSTADFDYDRRITLTLDKNSVSCKGEGREGWIREEAEIKYSGKPVSFTVHPTFLKEILEHVNRVKIGEDKLLFRSSSFQHVVALSG